tara:strand:- start:250 stop:432 length:183 start_codon:yes stop_codon:yes gene_type:complete
MPEMQQEDKTAEGNTLFEIKIDMNNSTTSFNKNMSITLVSKTENCKELIKIAKETINDMS